MISLPEIADCLAEKTRRMNTIYTIVDEAGSKIPYSRREVQRDFAANRHGMDVVLKSRQHGLSSETDLDILDDALFVPNLQCGIIAHTKIDAQSLFETKVKLPYNALHDEIRKRCPAIKCDAGTLRLANGSEIRVAVSFRSATTHRLHISEYGKICAKFPSRAEEIKTGTLPSIHPQLGGRCVVEGTAEGAGGHFYELCTQAQADTAQAKAEGRPLSPLQFKFHFYAWWQDPKNAVNPLGITVSDDLKRYFEELADTHVVVATPDQVAWYAAKKDGAGGLGSAMKREHPSTPAEAFETSVEGAVFGEQLEKARSEGRIGFYPWIQNLPVYTFWDLGFGNATCVGFVQFPRDQVRFIDYHAETGRGAPYHAHVVKSKPYTYAEHHMPHDVMNHEKGTGIVLKDTYAGLLDGIIKTVPRVELKRDSIEALADMFGSICFNSKTCSELVRALSYYRFEWDENLCVYSKEPVHDWASDPADMAQQLAIQYRIHKVFGNVIQKLKLATVEAEDKKPVFSSNPVEDYLA